MNDRLRLEYLYKDNSTYTDDIFNISNEELDQPFVYEDEWNISGFVIGFLLVILVGK